MAQSSPYTAHPPEWPRVAQRSLYTSTFTRVLPSTSSTAYPPQVDLAGMRGCQALKYRSSETSQVSTRCVVLFSIKNPFRAEPLFSCEDQFFEGGEFRSKVIFLTYIHQTKLELFILFPDIDSSNQTWTVYIFSWHRFIKPNLNCLYFSPDIDSSNQTWTVYIFSWHRFIKPNLNCLHFFPDIYSPNQTWTVYIFSWHRFIKPNLNGLHFFPDIDSSNQTWTIYIFLLT